LDVGAAAHHSVFGKETRGCDAVKASQPCCCKQRDLLKEISFIVKKAHLIEYFPYNLSDYFYANFCIHAPVNIQTWLQN
jgi:hypothetical protein